MNEKQYNQLEKIFGELEDIDEEFNLQGLFTCQCLKKIIRLLRQKVCIEQQSFPQIVSRLDTLIGQLGVKILLEQDQDPVVTCCADISGTVILDISPQSGHLFIDVCDDCDITDSTFFFQRLNPTGFPLSTVQSPIFESTTCDLTGTAPDVTGSVTMTGTAAVTPEQGQPQTNEPFTLTLEFENGDLIAFTIETSSFTESYEADEFESTNITVNELC
ncbi:MAG: hypothetical protein ACOCRZ_05650 [Halothermotrichaceae bacterium]